MALLTTWMIRARYFRHQCQPSAGVLDGLCRGRVDLRRTRVALPGKDVVTLVNGHVSKIHPDLRIVGIMPEDGPQVARCCRKVVLPAANQEDVAAIYEDVTRHISLEYVETLDQALPHLLAKPA